MRLTELMTAVGATALALRSPTDRDPDVREVLLDDGVTPLGPCQMVLAVQTGQVLPLLERCRESGCEVVVVPAGSGAETRSDGPVIVESTTAWTQLFILVRTVLLGSHDEATAEDGAGSPTTVHDLADAIAVMVGGTVVLYDRAHRVIAYSVQGHVIDDVRRDAILGRRTPDQWIRRFKIDRTAYQTYAAPGTVVRVGDYDDLRTRLRIAVHAGAEVIGEISVAEGNTPFPADAETALRRAAEMAVPAMLRHRRATDVDQLTRDRAVQAMLRQGSASAHEHGCTLPFLQAGSIAVVAVRVRDAQAQLSGAHEVLAERLVHFLSLHVRSLSPGAQVVYLKDTFYALVPDADGGETAVERLAGVVVRQLHGMKVSANAAIPGAVRTLAELPLSKERSDDLLRIADDGGITQQVLSTTRQWAELVVAAATRKIEGRPVPRSPLNDLQEFDAEHNSDMVKTLRVYLESFGSVSTAAGILFLHSNTLRHRLGRISEISGIDLDSPVQRLAMSLLLAAPQQHPRRDS